MTGEDRKELIYLDSVLDSISRSESLSEISEIRDELTAAGYIKRPKEKKKTRRHPVTGNIPAQKDIKYL